MKSTQWLILEIGEACNLGEAHAAHCPNTHVDRFTNTVGRRPLDTEKIIDIVREAHQVHGFRGLVGFHYYCEPMLEWMWIRELVVFLKAEVPQAKFGLWTNGTLLPVPDELRIFSKIIVTNYGNLDLFAYRDAGLPLRIVGQCFDQRLCFLQTASANRACWKPWTEFIVDHYGQIHLCCYDWRAEIEIGNVWDEPFADLVLRWQKLRAKVAMKRMTPDAPTRCLRCPSKYQNMRFIYDPVAEHSARIERGELSPEGDPDAHYEMRSRGGTGVEVR